MEYEWVCHVCDQSNTTSADECSHCNAPSELNSYEIAALKRMLACRGNIHPLNREATPSLNWWYWLVDVSNGKNAFIRAIGRIVLWLGITLILILLVARVLFQDVLSFDWVAIPLLFVGTLYIHNFCTGKEAGIGYLFTQATEKYTVFRWLGLVLAICVIAVGIKLVSMGVNYFGVWSDANYTGLRFHRTA